ncbi:acyl-CoA dehydrogenase family protein [Niveispirillum fermenti]|uniref:acyl-CoA dehydrogenase family protein n=1 Tax=Niveispirillum fermenti TaxID=1233113 RepID=UPI003A83A08C
MAPPDLSALSLPPARLLADCRAALLAAGQYLAMARHRLGRRVAPEGQVDAGLLTVHQHAAHGLAWIATYVASLRALLDWAVALEAQGALTPPERLILSAGFAEYLAQMAGGIPMGQGEFARPADLDLGTEAAMLCANPACARLMADGNGPAVRTALAALLADGRFGDPRHDDEVLGMMAAQLRRFVADRVAPFAHGWHRDNAYIPLDIIAEMADLGVFGLTVPEEWGGSGLGKLAMCVASEELSRGYIGVGSLGTRAEIAAELIRLGGTPAQKECYLPPIARGALLPTAVFTEPDTGSDLASLRTRAERVEKPDGSRVWQVTGNKTWITHAARADIMTLLVRTDPAQTGYRGLSMLLAEKPRGDDANPFPATGMSGGEIEVLGYRGMKEFEIRFDRFEVPEANLLGGTPGQGFKQLMETFESARIQTAARAVGVAQDALEAGLGYALDRRQFGQPLIHFPRVSGKLAWMAVETMMARQLSYAAARAKDGGRRCDMEAGMAKLLAARVAWSNADNALQIHGGNGFALEYRVSRLLCDARILSIFEGAAEIQAQVIARGLLGRDAA